MTESVVIVGAGLGGLQTGSILSRHGFKVTVLEAGHQVGGCLQSFRRGGCVFDTGLHYVGGLGEGESLRRLFDYFGLSTLPWRQLDRDCFDEVFLEGEGSFSLASGHDRFVDTLARRFPAQRKALETYAGTLKAVGDNIFKAFDRSGGDDGGMNAAFGRSAYEFLCSTISDPILRKVLSGTSLKVGLDAERLPLYVFAQINDSFIRSAWRLNGPGTLVADALVREIRSCGGEVLTDSRVVSLETDDSGVRRAVLEDGRVVEGDWFISDAHPAVTLSLVGQTRLLRRIYRSRIGGLRNSVGMFTASIVLKPGAMDYMKRNLYVHSREADLWRINPEKTESVLLHCYPPSEGTSMTHVDLISPMSGAGLENFASLAPGRRGKEYDAVKASKASECIDLVSKALPDFRNCIDKVYTSTPLTYQSYTGTPEGSAYGIVKDWQNPMGTVLAPRTPIPNLLLTGQSLNLHGVLGVSMTSVLTASCILGLEALRSEILNG